ncbi:hypothetical protein [Candidatus Pantoea formicae]|uniref:hypothetical protein n=1 Tax=Candidatus Pantoea formicae TaxID=2608355 RepID=UPI003EDB35FE
MFGFILLFMLILGLILIPYRKIYTRLNQLIDARLCLIGMVMIAFPFIWMLFAPEITDAPTVHENLTAQENVIDSLNGALGSMAVMLSWTIAVAGLVMIGFAVWTASEYRKGRTL